MCVREAAGGGGEGARDTESKTRTPHKVVGKNPTAKKSHSQEVSQQRIHTGKTSHSEKVSQQRSLKEVPLHFAVGLQ